jgi:GTP-binding protein Era
MRAGFVGVIGQPNAGKSSLVNALVKEKVSIVTAKPQTTRRRVLGILSVASETQYVFVDSPGLLQAESGLNGFLALEAKDVMDSSDVLLGVLSIDEKRPEALEEVLKFMQQSKKSAVFVIHKVDLVEFHRRIAKIKEMIAAAFPGAPIFEISSQKGQSDQAKAALLECLAPLLPESPAPLYEVDLFTPHSSRELVAEIVREKCFEILHQEVPYQLAVRVEKFDESNPDLLRIWTDIWVSRENHKPIVIGKQGANLKQIGILARKEIESILDSKVYLNLNVVVKEEWTSSARKMKDLGYVVEKE